MGVDLREYGKGIKLMYQCMLWVKTTSEIFILLPICYLWKYLDKEKGLTSL